MQRIALQRNDDLRHQFKAEISVFNPNQLVFSMKPWADPVLGKLSACLRYKISDILELLMSCSFTVKL